MRKIFFIGFLFMFSFFVFLGNAVGEVNLKLNLEEGKSYNIKMVSDQDISQTTQGQEMNIRQKIGMEYTYHVKEIDYYGDMLIDIAYDSVSFEQESANGKVKYDSSDPSQEVLPAALGFAALEGQSFSIKVSPEGKVKNVTGIDSIMQNIMKKINLPEGQVKEQIKKALKKQIGKETLKDQLEQMMDVYPEGPVSIGDSWSKRMVLKQGMSQGMSMIVNNTWTLKERSNGIAYIDVVSDISSPPSAEPIQSGPVKVSYVDISGRQEGEIQMDEDNGWIIKGNFTQHFSGKAKMESSVSGQENMSMSWPITVDGVMSFESTE